MVKKYSQHLKRIFGCFLVPLYWSWFWNWGITLRYYPVSVGVYSVPWCIKTKEIDSIAAISSHWPLLFNYLKWLPIKVWKNWTLQLGKRWVHWKEGTKERWGFDIMERGVTPTNELTSLAVGWHQEGIPRWWEHKTFCWVDLQLNPHWAPPSSADEWKRHKSKHWVCCFPLLLDLSWICCI